MRNMYEEEKDPKSKYYARPFRLVKNSSGKWVEEKYELDPSATYKVLFCEKVRQGSNSSDTGTAYGLRFDGDHCIFREVCQLRPRHGQIT